MRTTVVLDDELVRTAHELSGIRDSTELIREALNALIERESARRLALRRHATKDYKCSTPEVASEVIAERDPSLVS